MDREPDLIELRVETFEPLVGTEFTVRDPEAALVLTEAVKGDVHQNAPRPEPFSLIFTGPAQPPLEQRIYQLDHAVLGKLEIFLVPIGYDEGHRLRYEAVFN